MINEAEGRKSEGRRRWLRERPGSRTKRNEQTGAVLGRESSLSVFFCRLSVSVAGVEWRRWTSDSGREKCVGRWRELMG
jgi:hypothetical protein